MFSGMSRLSISLTIALSIFAAGTATERLAARQDTFEVTKPALGDTVTAGDSSGDTSLLSQWTVPQSLAARAVIITLVQGNNGSDLSRVQVVNGIAAIAEVFLQL